MKAILLAIAAGLCWGVGEVATRSALHSKEIGPFAAVMFRSLVALPLIVIAFLIARDFSAVEAQPLRGVSGATWSKIILGSGLVAGAAALIFFYAALSLGEISRIKPIAFALAPATGVVLGWLLLGEPMTARKVAGVFLILLGVVVLTK